MLRTIRYGEADRVLHLYTQDRGRVAAMAKGVRRTKTRFGGRLEPFFRLNVLLYEGRSELLTVTSAETVDPHAGALSDIVMFDTVTVTGEDVAVLLFAASRAAAVSVCGPFATPVVSQLIEYGADVSSAPRLAPSSLN